MHRGKVKRGQRAESCREVGGKSREHGEQGVSQFPHFPEAGRVYLKEVEDYCTSERSSRELKKANGRES